MSEDKIDHLFEPFFTTKAVGKGVGMGLATVYGIVDQNRGFVTVASEPGNGTVFTIYLPRHTVEKVEMTNGCDQGAVAVGRETILLVEDELEVLKLSKLILEEHGYYVESAATPADAIRLAENYRRQIHLLVTDVVMPEMNGKELADRLLMRFPEMGVIFVSGYTADVIGVHNMPDYKLNFIQKPYSIKVLASTVREVLDRGK